MKPEQTDDVALTGDHEIWLNPSPWADVDLEVCYQLDDKTGAWYRIQAVTVPDANGFVSVAVKGPDGMTWVLIEGWAWTREVAS